MKKYLVLLLVSICAVSCFKSTYSESRSIVAHFEYGPNVDFADDSTYFSPEGSGFIWDYLMFAYGVDTQTSEFDGGFKLSRQKGMLGKDTDGMDLTWRSHTNVAGNTYLVYSSGNSMPDADVAFIGKAYGTCSAQMCYVANTAKVAKEIQNTFERGDKLTLIAKGFLNNQETGTAEIALADFTQNDKDGQPKDSIVSTWTKFDLAKLGSYDKIKFSFESTKYVTRAFCMDEFRSNVSIEY